jgi:hypothetical protein
LQGDEAPKSLFFTKWLPHSRAEGSQVEPVLARFLS